MAGIMSKLSQLWNVPDDEYEEAPAEEVEREEIQESRARRRSERAANGRP